MPVLVVVRASIVFRRLFLIFQEFGVRFGGLIGTFAGFGCNFLRRR